jgi:hypothetical protein
VCWPANDLSEVRWVAEGDAGSWEREGERDGGREVIDVGDIGVWGGEHGAKGAVEG